MPQGQVPGRIHSKQYKKCDMETYSRRYGQANNKVYFEIDIL